MLKIENLKGQKIQRDTNMRKITKIAAIVYIVFNLGIFIVGMGEYGSCGGLWTHNYYQLFDEKGHPIMDEDGAVARVYGGRSFNWAWIVLFPTCVFRAVCGPALDECGPVWIPLFLLWLVGVPLLLCAGLEKLVEWFQNWLLNRET